MATPNSWVKPTISPFNAVSFTPTITSTGTLPTMTYTTQQGFYTVINLGSFSRIDCYINLIINTRSGGTGNITFSGLPFVANSQQSKYNVMGTYFTSTAAHHTITGFINSADNTVTSVFDGNSALAISSTGSGESFAFSFSYLV